MTASETSARGSISLIGGGPGDIDLLTLRAVERLPAMSLIFYPDDSRNEDSEAVYVLVEPADPFTEAIRTKLVQEVASLTPKPKAVPAAGNSVVAGSAHA